MFINETHRIRLNGKRIFGLQASLIIN